MQQFRKYGVIKFLRYFLLLLIFFCTMNCSSKKDPLFMQSETLPAYNQPTFAEYIKENRQWIKENRVFVSENHDLELEMNSPFELKPKLKKNQKKGILLVHGLSDSPGYFKDIAGELRDQGFLVRVVLLTGHGSRPADLIDVDFDDWTALVKHHIGLLQKKVDELWLGGFSTGTNLVTCYALENEKDIAGLLLFSPGFVSDEENMLFWAPLASHFKTWATHNKKSGNILRYDSLAMNGASLYYRSLKQVRALLEEKTFNKPVFITISQADSVIKADAIPQLFEKNFKHPDSRLIWFGKPYKSNDKRIISMPGYIPDQRIANFSHLSVLFKPVNPVYGKNSSFRMYRNGQDRIFDGKDDELWFSAWGYKKDDLYFARLTWNPYFLQTVNIMNKVVNGK